MLEVLPQIMPYLVPITALMIGGMIVGGIFVVQPLVKAITRLSETNNAKLAGQADQDTRRLEERLSRIETVLDRLVEERRFERELGAGPSTAGARTDPAESGLAVEVGGRAGAGSDSPRAAEQ